MPEFRRAFLPGGTFFFTVVTEGRAPILTDRIARDCLRQAMRDANRRWPLTIDALVLLPDHLHALWTLPPGDADFSTRWSFIKGAFARGWLKVGGRERAVSTSRLKSRRRGVWQRRFWEHTIRDEQDFERHCDYIHYNPVKHELVRCPHAWPYSSFRRWVRRRAYSLDWHCVCARRHFRPPDFADLEETAME